MKITPEHILFFRQKTANRQWIIDNTKERKADVHLMINSQDPGPRDRDHTLGNLIALLRSARNLGYRRGGGSLEGYLVRLSTRPGTTMNPEGRRRFANKWLKRLNEHRVKYKVQSRKTGGKRWHDEAWSYDKEKVKRYLSRMIEESDLLEWRLKVLKKL